MLIPPYCPEDKGGSLSQSEALELLHVMQQRFDEEVYNNQATEGDNATFHHADGASQALLWCIELLERIEIDPQHSRNAMLESAKKLESMATALRNRAGDSNETSK